MTVSPDIQLSIYNGALRELGSRELASLDEAREPRRVLDSIWGADNQIVRYALSRGEWNWALRSIMADASSSVEPPFGFRYAFQKPDDFARLAGLAADEYFQARLTNEGYIDEAGFWFSDCTPLFVRYVSNGDDYGMNSALWGESFRRYLELHMADLGCERITNSTTRKDRLQRDALMMLKEAKSADAMNEGSKPLPHGSWAMSRSGGRRGQNA